MFVCTHFISLCFRSGRYIKEKAEISFNILLFGCHLLRKSKVKCFVSHTNIQVDTFKASTSPVHVVSKLNVTFVSLLNM